MISRKFTFQDNFLLAAAFTLLVAIVCYIFVGKPLFAKIEDARREQSAVEDELEIQKHMAERKDSMNLQMEQKPQKGKGELGAYNNLTCEMKELGEILAEAKSYEFHFSQEEFSGNIVRRDILVSFQTDSYEQAREILEAVENGKYRCLVKAIDLTKEQEIVYGNLLVTYYETAEEEYKVVMDGGLESQDDREDEDGRRREDEDSRGGLAGDDWK
ncbi:MAG: hypothetical protein HFG65_05535 [Hungatella sp.]|nr:hypothetical protein [Hungatella sp.]